MKKMTEVKSVEEKCSKLEKLKNLAESEREKLKEAQVTWEGKVKDLEEKIVALGQNIIERDSEILLLKRQEEESSRDRAELETLRLTAQCSLCQEKERKIEN